MTPGPAFSVPIEHGLERLVISLAILDIAPLYSSRVHDRVHKHELELAECWNCSLANAWLFDEKQSPEIQTMYSLNIPVSAIRTKIRQEFEKHRYVQQMKAIDVLLFQSSAEFQVSFTIFQYLLLTTSVGLRPIPWEA